MIIVMTVSGCPLFLHPAHGQPDPPKGLFSLTWSNLFLQRKGEFKHLQLTHHGGDSCQGIAWCILKFQLKGKGNTRGEQVLVLERSHEQWPNGLFHCCDCFDQKVHPGEEPVCPQHFHLRKGENTFKKIAIQIDINCPQLHGLATDETEVFFEDGQVVTSSDGLQSCLM